MKKEIAKRQCVYRSVQHNKHLLFIDLGMSLSVIQMVRCVHPARQMRMDVAIMKHHWSLHVLSVKAYRHVAQNMYLVCRAVFIL